VGSLSHNVGFIVCLSRGEATRKRKGVHQLQLGFWHVGSLKGKSIELARILTAMGLTTLAFKKQSE